MNRRGVLGSLLALPFGARAAAEAVKVQAMGAMSIGGMRAVPMATLSSGNCGITISSVAEFMRLIGTERAAREAMCFTGYDPDILEMRLPSVTKVRMQRARNYVRALDEQRADAGRRLLNGSFQWWP